ncbi:hypothetical protein WJX74_006224 [Apatococcus lobatus]|uniref:Uncharacterized protein n=1 Tax=Apatococcus lobatus TaxID=904363 RepID=A0AAW1RC76_9CHLO
MPGGYASANQENPAPGARCTEMMQQRVGPDKRGVLLEAASPESEEPACFEELEHWLAASEWTLFRREVRGLVWTASPKDAAMGSVHYDVDPSYPHECVAIKISNEMTKQLQVYGKDLDEELSFAIAPRVELETRSKEGDLTISPLSGAHLNCAPTCVMEVGVCHKNLEELELEGEEWMQRPEVQAVILIKVFHEARPASNCPRMLFRLGTRQVHGSGAWTDWQAFGRDTQCVTHGLPDYTASIPWVHIFHGSALLSRFGHDAFQMDLFKIRRIISKYYQHSLHAYPDHVKEHPAFMQRVDPYLKSATKGREAGGAGGGMYQQQ